MGLGPHGSSLLDRTGQPTLVWRDPFAMMLEQTNRQEARRLKAIWYSERHKKPAKPLAPCTPEPKVKGQPRMWRWIGETIQSKGLLQDGTYDQSVIRAAGFKLPAIGGKKKNETHD